jgi:hypothetical protein
MNMIGLVLIISNTLAIKIPGPIFLNIRIVDRAKTEDKFLVIDQPHSEPITFSQLIWRELS